MKRFIAYLLKGLLLVLPIGLTFYILFASIKAIDGMLGIGIPGLGFLIVIALLTLIGFLMTHFIPNPLIQLMENGINRMPLVKLIYSSIKDLTEAVIGDKKKFKQPVLVEMSSSGIQKMGFITETDLEILNIKDKVAVYFPHSYNFSGNLFIVPVSKIQIIKANSSDVMKFIISAGVSNLTDSKSEEKKRKTFKDILRDWLIED